MKGITVNATATERLLVLIETGTDAVASPAEIAAEVHDDLIRRIMEEPAGPLRVRVRGAGTGLPWRPVNGLPKDGAV